MRFIAVALVVWGAGCESGRGTAVDATASETTVGTETVAETFTGETGLEVAGETAAETTPVAPDPDFATFPGELRLELFTWGLAFRGWILAVPATPYHNEAERSGACRLLTYTIVPCTPECALGDTCVAGTCHAPAALLGAGPLTLRGFPGAPIMIGDAATQNYFFQTQTVSAHDVGPMLTLSSAGTDAVPAFSLAVVPVSAPRPDGDWAALMAARAPGADVTLRWTNPEPGSRIYLRMTTGVATHGGISPVEIECESADSGQLVLPGSYLDRLYGASAWGCGECGENDVYRYQAASAGGIRFRAEARASFIYRP